MNYTDTVRTSSDLRTLIYLVSATLWVHKHQQRLHELRGKRLHQERLPAAILQLRDTAETQENHRGTDGDEAVGLMTSDTEQEGAQSASQQI